MTRRASGIAVVYHCAMSHEHKALTDLRALALGSGRPRVWSLVVTILGDIGVPIGGWLPMKTMQDIGASLGVSSTALRTALSRLAHDGWVDRRRDGRLSTYRLSIARDEDYRRAEATIYRRSPADPETWTLLIQAPGEGTTNNVGIPLRPGVSLISAQGSPDPQAFVLSGKSTGFPDWVRHAAVSETSRTRLRNFWSCVRLLEPSAVAALPMAEARAVRVLMIHEWRRIVLRTPLLPPALVPPDYPQQATVDHVAALYPLLVSASGDAAVKGRFERPYQNVT